MKSATSKLFIPDLSNFEVNYYVHFAPTVSKPRVYPHHIHDRLELYVLLDGDVSFAVESSVYKLSAGDAIIIKPNEVHNCILDSSCLHKHACFWFDCSNDFLFGDFIEHDFGKNNLISLSPDKKERVFELCTILNDQSLANDKHKLLYVFLELLDIYRKFITASAPNKEIPNILKNILSDIALNFRTINSLSYFTDKYFISQSTLNRLFKTHLHSSPKYYLETKRLAYSRRLLKSGANVLSACMESGFTDYSNYIRLFKNRFGLTPKQYRDN